jgi:PAXNEB protein
MALSFKRCFKPTLSPPGNIPSAVAGSTRSHLVGLRGTKPSEGGAYLTSTGLRDLDTLLSGGHPLGTVILVEEDRWTNRLAHTLVRYWCAEALAQGHPLVVPTLDDSDDKSNKFRAVDQTSGTDLVTNHLLNNLPRNLHWDKQQQQHVQHEAKFWPSPILEASSENEDDDIHGNDEAAEKVTDLVGQNIQPRSFQMSQVTNVYCHSYDLSGKLSQQLKRRGKPDTEGIIRWNLTKQGTPDASKREIHPSLRIYQQLMQHLQDKLVKDQPSRSVLRILLFHLDPKILGIVLPLLLAQIRAQLMPVVVLVCSQPWKATTTNVALRRHADVVLQTHGFAGERQYPPPSELRHLQGLILPRKVSTATLATALCGGHYGNLAVGKRPPANILGIQRDSRKMHTVLLHIPPQEQLLQDLKVAQPNSFGKHA